MRNVEWIKSQNSRMRARCDSSDAGMTLISPSVVIALVIAAGINGIITDEHADNQVGRIRFRSVTYRRTQFQVAMRLLRLGHVGLPTKR